MQTLVTRRDVQTVMDRKDRKAIARFTTMLGRHTKIPQLGLYRRMSDDEIWFRLVSQVCVMGSSRGMAAIGDDAQRKQAFMRAIAPRRLLRSRSPAVHLAKVLREFKATRFPTKNAKTLVKVLRVPTVYSGGHFVLLKGVPRGDSHAIRDALIERCPIFGLKSASDFMINVGLSHDVIALDVRVIGALRHYLDFNLRAARVQGRRRVYLSVEDALRSACPRRTPLALLDRVLFRFSGMSALEFAMRAGR